MTRDEAIRRMECCRNFLANNYSDMGEPNITAFNMAISALEQEPCDDDRQKVITRAFTEGYMKGVKYTEEEYCEDTISREAVIEDVMKCTDMNEDTLDVLIEKTEQLPPVTPSSRKGHWIEVTNGRGGHECDLCHEYAPSYQDGDEYLTKYCPNCGAEMESEE